MEEKLVTKLINKLKNLKNSKLVQRIGSLALAVTFYDTTYAVLRNNSLLIDED